MVDNPYQNGMCKNCDYHLTGKMRDFCLYTCVKCEDVCKCFVKVENDKNEVIEEAVETLQKLLAIASKSLRESEREIVEIEKLGFDYWLGFYNGVRTGLLSLTGSDPGPYKIK